MSDAGFDARGAAAALKAAIVRRDVDVTVLYGVAPGGPRIRCPLHNGGDPNFEVYDNGRWRCHSRCGSGGDVFSFVACRELGAVAGAPLRGSAFADAVRRTFEVLGVDLLAYGCARDPSNGGTNGKPYPPAAEVARLLAYAHELPLTGETFAIGGRARPGVGSNAVAAGLDLCAVLGEDDKKARPKWAAKWPAGKLFATYDARGALASVHLRPDDPNQSKGKNPSSFNPSAFLMNEPMRAMLRGESQEERDRARLLGYETARESAISLGVVLVEGAPSYCAWARWHAGPVGGLPGQKPSATWLQRIPRDAPVLLDFDPDLVGVDYLIAALKGLVYHLDVRVSARMRWILDRLEDAKKNADAIASALVEARKSDPRLLDPDEIPDGPRVESMGFVKLSSEERAAIVGQGAGFGSKWQAELRLNEEGRVVASEGNLIAALKADERWLGVLGWDERSDRITLMRAPPVPDLAARGPFPRELRDEDASHIGAWYEQQCAVEFKNASIHRALGAVAALHPFDRVREYLERVSGTWDKTARLDTWLIDCLGVEDTPLARAVGAKWMISAVARTFRPGCQADYVLVLEGEQGLRKSSAFAALCADPLCFTDALPDLRQKKEATEIVTSGVLIAELAEFDAASKAEASAVKAFVTRRREDGRAAYGRHVRNRPRRVVLCATTNEGGYLKDQTGNRRFWPVRATRIDIVTLTAIRDQLWAEATVRYQRGETWYLDDPELERDAAAEQETRREVDPWETVIRGYLETWREMAMRGATSGKPLRLESLPSSCLEKLEIAAAAQTPREARRVNGILRSLGWDRVQRRDGDGASLDGKRPRRWAWEPTARWLGIDGSPGSRAGSPGVSPGTGDLQLPGIIQGHQGHQGHQVARTREGDSWDDSPNFSPPNFSTRDAGHRVTSPVTDRDLECEQFRDEGVVYGPESGGRF